MNMSQAVGVSGAASHIETDDSSQTTFGQTRPSSFGAQKQTPPAADQNTNQQSVPQAATPTVSTNDTNELNSIESVRKEMERVNSEVLTHIGDNILSVINQVDVQEYIAARKSVLQFQEGDDLESAKGALLVLKEKAQILTTPLKQDEEPQNAAVDLGKPVQVNTEMRDSSQIPDTPHIPSVDELSSANTIKSISEYQAEKTEEESIPAVQPEPVVAPQVPKVDPAPVRDAHDIQENLDRIKEAVAESSNTVAKTWDDILSVARDIPAFREEGLTDDQIEGVVNRYLARGGLSDKGMEKDEVVSGLLAIYSETKVNAPVAAPETPVSQPVSGTPVEVRVVENIPKDDQVSATAPSVAQVEVPKVQTIDLNAPEVTDGLNRLLVEWPSFKGSGMLGFGPGGMAHPLYARLAHEPVTNVLTGRWDEPDQGFINELREYASGWKREQGVEPQESETFEMYLRRVIATILDKRAEIDARTS